MPLSRKKGAEFAGDKGVQGAEAVGKLEVGEAALSLKLAEMVFCRTVIFLRVTLLTAGDEVAVGIVLEFDARDDMVEAAGKGGEVAKAIKATTAFPGMDGPTAGRIFQIVEIFEATGASPVQGKVGNLSRADGRNLPRQAHLDQMTRFVAFHEAQDAAGNETAQGPASGVVRDTDTTTKPDHGKTELAPTHKAAVTEEMGIDSAVGNG